MRILLVEDDEAAAQLLRETLKTQHHLVDLATDGEVALELAETYPYDLILLDVVLPKLDGISLCQQLRSEGDRTPILLLTAEDTSTGKVAGLDAGADDYIVKPFDSHELLARIRAVMRRGSSTIMSVIEWENLRLDPNNCKVTYNNQPLHLTAKEYGLLELFLRNTQRIFSQNALLNHLWSFDEPPSENTVRAHIKSLRQKLKSSGAVDVIETVYGMGYRLRSQHSGVRSQETALRSQEEQSTLSRGAEEAEEAEEQNAARGSMTAGKQRSRVEKKYSDAPSPQPPIPPSPHHPISPSPHPTTRLADGIAAIWEKFKDKYSDRVTVLEQAVTALSAGLDAELRKQAIAQAHTLTGSLGSFGFSKASDISRELEQAFKSEETLDSAAIQHLSQLIVTLRGELEKPLPQKEIAVSSAPIVEQVKLLIVDDDAQLTAALIAAALERGMQAHGVYNLSEARKAIARSQPDVVLLDLCFPDDGEHGFALLAELTTKQPPIPVIVFTATESFADRVKAARLGARGFLQKPVSPSGVMQTVTQVRQNSTIPEAKLLIVDENPQNLDFLRSLLSPWGFQLTLVDRPQQFWDTLEQTQPDLLILAVEMTELSGIDLCQVIRNAPQWRELPVLCLCDRADTSAVQQLFQAGANDYINQPIVESELLARILNQIRN